MVSSVTFSKLATPTGTLGTGGSGNGGNGINRAEAWVRGALPKHKIFPWMVKFAENWLDISERIKNTGDFAQSARTVLRNTIADIHINPNKVLPALEDIEKPFSTDQYRNRDGFGRCVLKLALFADMVSNEYNLRGQEINDYLGPLQLFKNQQLVETGLRLAEVIFIKTAGFKLAVRTLLTVLPVELFNYNPELFEAAIQRLAQTTTVLKTFETSILILAKVYAGKPEGFMEGLDIIDRFVDNLKQRGIDENTIARLFAIGFDEQRQDLGYHPIAIFPFLVQAYANYQEVILQKEEVSSTHLSTSIPTQVKASANPPDWFKAQVHLLEGNILKLKEKKIDPDRYINFYNRIISWVYISMDHSAECTIQIINVIHNELLSGKTDREVDAILYHEVENLPHDGS
ncbi:MAG: hypothetical protein FD145_650 [Candidatus Saganbacteria bacterium]|uniref:Uncharacterized protein n=1 Tax=Candidatus Saganbacteria bacterium TaxID=2575572 RepID=A0A833L1C2_UNCSA|nr:MAG: hypothetical protein FD145_650 [Candidatus Saganbacteria bacterium]